jgi:nucleoside-diphosphate-sugar epimerase
MNEDENGLHVPFQDDETRDEFVQDWKLTRINEQSGTSIIFTYVDDGIDALMRIIDNKDGIANGKIYNIGNPKNNHSIRELANQMLEIARSIPEYAKTANEVKIIETTSGAYYGEGYQDVQNRVPAIDNTMSELGWKPTTTMSDALKNIFEAYREDVEKARSLVDKE